MAGERIVVLGGGFGGASAALTARRLLGTQHRVTLVDRRTEIGLCGANPLVVVGERPRAGLSRTLDLVASAGVEVVNAEINGVDLGSRQVGTGDGPVSFDHLVVALGADYDWDATPGAVDAHTFYHGDGTTLLAERLDGFDGGTVAVVVAAAPVRCPPAALEMVLLIEDWARRRGIRQHVDLHLVIPEPAPLPVAGPAASRYLTDLFGVRGIALHAGTTLAEVANGGTEARFVDGSSLRADVLVVVPVHRAPPVVESSGLTEGRPWVPVDPATLETSIDGVFAIGDVNTVPFGENAAVPKAGAFASAQGRTVGEVIVARVLGDDPPATYAGHGACFMAVSLTEAAQVGGTFLGDAGPAVGLGPASSDTMDDMVRWERDWEQYRI